MPDILHVENLGKTYQGQSGALTVLEGVSFNLQEGDTISIVGPSGSGKTTLLGLCAGLDTPTSGSVSIYRQTLNTLSENARARLRNAYTGFIFQNFQLIPTLTAIENVMIPIELGGKPGAAATAKQLLDRVGLADRAHHYPSQLSGGEQQRIALARAFANTPKILFADEPTGNLDDDTSHKIEELLFEMNNEHKTTLVIVTHDMELAQKTRRIMRLRGGRVISDEKQDLAR